MKLYVTRNGGAICFESETSDGMLDDIYLSFGFEDVYEYAPAVAGVFGEDVHVLLSEWAIAKGFASKIKDADDKA